jgi:hypothetical protein
MKIRLIYRIIIVFCVMTNFSCSKDSIPTPVIDGTWNLRNVGGGLNGIDDDYQQGIIKWVFNSPANFDITIENNNFPNTNYNGFESGIYNYSILEMDSKTYLIIDGSEFGGYILADSDLIINQNETSTGSGADGYILKFEK